MTQRLRVSIRAPVASDCSAFLGAVARSASLHGRWVSAPATAKAFAKYLGRFDSQSHFGFLVVHRDSRELVGVINLGHVIRGGLQSAFLGYYAFSPFERQGLMHEGIALVIRYAFEKLKLHRLEANVQPGNRASIALIKRCGFVREGFSRRYLKIRGRWRDHERWALLNGGLKVVSSDRRKTKAHP